MPHTELYRDAAGEVRWRTQADNGEIVGEGGEGYDSRDGAIHGLTVLATALAELLPQLQQLALAGSAASTLEADAEERGTSTFSFGEGV